MRTESWRSAKSADLTHLGELRLLQLTRYSSTSLYCLEPSICGLSPHVQADQGADVVVREVLLGFTGKDYTIVAASKAAMRGATILKASDDKTRQLNDHTLMAFSGEAGDTSQ